MRRVVHLIPYDGIGGVEAAARTMARVDAEDLRFEVRWLFPDVASRAQRGATYESRAHRLISRPCALALWAPAVCVEAKGRPPGAEAGP